MPDRRLLQPQNAPMSEDEMSPASRVKRSPGLEVTALNRREPALVIAFIVFVIAFVVQVAAGVELPQAIGTAAAASGLQGYLTRQRVYSPATVASARDQTRRRATPRAS